MLAFCIYICMRFAFSRCGYKHVHAWHLHQAKSIRWMSVVCNSLWLNTLTRSWNLVTTSVAQETVLQAHRHRRRHNTTTCLLSETHKQASKQATRQPSWLEHKR